MAQPGRRQAAGVRPQAVVIPRPCSPVHPAGGRAQVTGGPCAYL